MQEFYHLDLSEPGLLEARSGRWLKTRLQGLFIIDSRITRAFRPAEEKEG